MEAGFFVLDDPLSELVELLVEPDELPDPPSAGLLSPDPAVELSVPVDVVLLDELLDDVPDERLSVL